MESKNPIQVADRLFDALEILSEDGPLALSDLTTRLELNKSTVHRILSSLIYMGYVRQDPDTQKYDLTLKLLEMSNRLLERMDILEIIRPYLKQLCHESGETVHLVQLEGTDAVYIHKEESFTNTIRMVSRVGSRIPVYCSGVGKALAADMDLTQVKQIWDNSEIRPLTEHTITDYSSFIQKLDEVRRQGYALDDEENEYGVRCIAAALTSSDGQPRFAFSISAPINRMSDERIRELSHLVLSVKRQLSRISF
ncbi:MAG: IclR family transcriptional regulator [Clostridiales bacterium]|nr:IclR family transcriptional regulator [Candidatus Blautia equi]